MMLDWLSALTATSLSAERSATPCRAVGRQVRGQYAAYICSDTTVKYFEVIPSNHVMEAAVSAASSMSRFLFMHALLYSRPPNPPRVPPGVPVAPAALPLYAGLLALDGGWIGDVAWFAVEGRQLVYVVDVDRLKWWPKTAKDLARLVVEEIARIGLSRPAI